jgi:Holliday junction resolvase-like predicted endonuclease
VYRFVEVKTISRVTHPGQHDTNMSAEDHIHPAKMKRLARTVEVYMAELKGDHDYQIDVVTVELDTATRNARCKLYEQVL